MATTRVYLLGDATLDSLPGLLNRDGSNVAEAKSRSVEGQLQTGLGSGYQVVNLAYDGFTTSSALGGGTVGEAFQGGLKLDAYVRERLSSDLHDRQVFPLKRLSEEILQDPSATHYVVISVGGKDLIQHIINHIGRIGIEQIRNQYLGILTQVKQIQGNIRPILVFHYRAGSEFDVVFIRTFRIMLGCFSAMNMICVATIAAAGIALVARKIRVLSGATFILSAAAVLALSSRAVTFRDTANIFRGQSPGITFLGLFMESLYKGSIRVRVENDKLPILILTDSSNPPKARHFSAIEPNRTGEDPIVKGLCRIVTKHDYTSALIYSERLHGNH